LLRLRRHGAQGVAVRVYVAWRQAIASAYTGINTSLLVEHAYNPIHCRYQYDPAGELVRTLDKLRGEIKYAYEANGQSTIYIDMPTTQFDGSIHLAGCMN